MAHDLSAMGITGIQSVADLLADFGRGGDGYFAHTTEGETVVPLDVLDENPRLKEALFTQMREMGLEPGRYIVGNELNSINPITGQPEFFLKSFFRGLKRVVKDVAPIVLPAVFAASPLGPILGPAFGAGIGSVIAGRSTKDSFKAAAIAGGTAAALRVAGRPEGVDPFTQIKADISSPWQRLTSTVVPGLGSYPDQRTGYWRSPFEYGFGDANAPRAGSAASITERLLPSGTRGGTMSSYSGPTETNIGPIDSSVLRNVGGGNVLGSTPVTPPAGVSGYVQDPGFFESLRSGFAPGGLTPLQGVRQAFLPARMSIEQALATKGLTLNTATQADLELAESLIKLSSPGAFRSYVPLVGAGLGLLAATGGFKPGKQPDPVDYYGGVTGTDLLAQAPGKFSVGVPRVFDRASLGDISALTAYPYTAQAGGPINYPPRVGPIYGPGTGTSDDVPAMLSDGEYVMTADAVRGAGNGNRQQGMRNMYDMMRQFEGRVV